MPDSGSVVVSFDAGRTAPTVAVTDVGVPPVEPPVVDAAAPPKRRLARASSVPLTMAVHGIDGTLALLMDTRLIEAGWKKSAEAIADAPVQKTPLGDAWYRSRPLAAVLQLEDAAGKIIESETRPPKFVTGLALDQMELAKLHPLEGCGVTAPIYQLDTYQFTNVGYTAGPRTYYLRVRDGHVRWVESADRKELFLMSAFGVSFRREPTSDGGCELLLSSCSDLTHSMHLTRYVVDETDAWPTFTRDTKEACGGGTAAKIYPRKDFP